MKFQSMDIEGLISVGFLICVVSMVLGVILCALIFDFIESMNDKKNKEILKNDSPKI